MCYHRLKNAAKRRGIPFDLTRDQFAQFAQETGYAYKRGRTVQGWHIDRIDPLRGYTLDNVRALPASDNCRKGAGPDKAAHGQLRARLQRWYNPQLKKMQFWFTHDQTDDPTCNCQTCRERRLRVGADPDAAPF